MGKRRLSGKPESGFTKLNETAKGFTDVFLAGLVVSGKSRCDDNKS
jgi:hypothetical protein